MKILWLSNAPWSPTGYGQQTAHFVPALRDRLGHEMKISAFWGLQGGALHWDGIEILPGSRDTYKNDRLLAEVEFHQPDVVIGLVDIWVLNPALLQATDRFYNWTPVDTETPPAATMERVKASRGVIAMSRFGVESLKAEGADNIFYVPHGVPADVYAPKDRAVARKALKLPDEAFVVLMVAANKGSPSRKSFSQSIRAFAAFHKHHPDSVLYLHTDVVGYAGEDIVALCEATLPRDSYRFAPQYRLSAGLLDSEHMANLYSAADVTLNPAQGGGFELALLESQMCGTPVITTNFSAMPEVARTGWLVEPIDKVWTPRNAWWVIPSTEEITARLIEAYKVRGDEDFRMQARAKVAVDYDRDNIVDKYWKPALEAMEREAERDRHLAVNEIVDLDQFAPVGVFDNGWFVRPILDPSSDVAYCERADSGKRKLRRGYGMDVNGFELDIEDGESGSVAKVVCHEASNTYDLANLNLGAGDVILDVGAHVGIVSIYLARAYPGVQVFAFEPIGENFKRMKRNIRANKADKNIVAINKAVTADGRRVSITGDLSTNTGGASAFTHPGSNGAICMVDSFSLPDFIARNLPKDKRVALLKLDCEGMEHEIVDALPDEILARIDRVVGEVHMNNWLDMLGWSPARLRERLESHIPADKITLHTIRIPDMPAYVMRELRARIASEVGKDSGNE